MSKRRHRFSCTSCGRPLRRGDVAKRHRVASGKLLVYCKDCQATWMLARARALEQEQEFNRRAAETKSSGDQLDSG
jgi:RNase P subunit RPR2